MGNETMRVELITSGGLTGQGVGAVRVEGSSATIDGRVTTQLTEAEEARLHRLPIVRASRPEQVEQNAAASGIELDEETLAAIDEAVGAFAVRDPTERA